MSNTEFNIINMADVEAVAVKWLWKPYIPLGKITIIQGDPGEGKTTLALSIAAALTQGENLPNEVETKAPVNVIYQTAEDGLADTIKPRLEAVNADCARVLVIDESKEELSMTDERIEKAIQQTGAKLIILDPIQAYIGANVDMHRANEIRPVMSKLGRIAEEYGCAVVLIGHMNKAAGQKSSYRGLGSIDITAVARRFMRENYPDIITAELVGEKFNELARKIDAEAWEMWELLRRQYAEKNPRPKTFDEIVGWEKTRSLYVEHEVMEQVVLCCRSY